MELLEETDLDYALTTYQAETLVQGFLFPSTTDFYIQPSRQRSGRRLSRIRDCSAGGTREYE